MPHAIEVTPKKWKNIRVLSDNGRYSVIAGDFEGKPRLGERWNGESDSLGFPNSAGYPVWHTLPSFLEVAVLQGCREELLRKPSDRSNLSWVDE